MLTREQFVTHLHEALNHLYEPHALRRSPLALFFGISDRLDTPSALQRILVEAIQSLRPPASEPTGSRAWQVYVPLSYRYVERLSPVEIADQMSISVRHLRRKERDAVQALADLLWDRYGVGSQATKGVEVASSTEAESRQPARLDGLDWLKEAAHSSRTNPDQALPDIMQLSQRLAEKYGVRLKAIIPRGLPPLAIDPVALRQILISLITVVMPRATGGEVVFTAAAQRWEVEFHLRCPAYPSGAKPTLASEADNLNLAQHLAQLCMATLILAIDARVFDARLSIPAVERLPVLVIDDHEDTLRLLQRFAAGTRYRLITTRDPAQALALAKEHSPQAIILDVMMPGVDGWAVMAQLQQSPACGHVPILVCTILAQEELALFLGASAFLRKPVGRQALLATLDRLVQPTAAELC